jgi:hypothetical protein
MSRFVVDSPLAPSDHRVERPEVDTLEAQLRALEFPTLIGQRHVGRTTVQRRVGQSLAADGYRVLHLNLTELGLNFHATIFDAVRVVAESAFRDLGRELNMRAPSPIYADVPVDYLERAISMLEPSQASPLIFMIDGCEHVNPRVAGQLLHTLKALRERAGEDEPNVQGLRWVGASLAGFGPLSDYQRAAPDFEAPPNVVHVGDFPLTTETEETLAAGFASGRARDRRRAVRYVLQWTAGDPAPTMDLLRALDQAPSLAPKAVVEAAVLQRVKELHEQLISEPWSEAWKRRPRWLIARSEASQSGVPEKDLVRAFLMYSEITQGDVRYVHRGHQALVNATLLPAGLVKWDGETLRARNRLSAVVFNSAWARGVVADLKLSGFSFAR